MKSKKGMGFKAVENKIAQEYEKKGKSPAEAKRIGGAAAASAARNASPAAKRKNPNLKKVKMAKKRV